MTVSGVFAAAAAVLASIGSGGAIVWALSSWLGKVWAARILEADRLRYQEQLEALKNQFHVESQKLDALLQHSVFVSRHQFEAKYAMLTELWKAVADVRGRIAGLRNESTVPLEDDDAARRARLEQRASRFAEARSRLIDVLYGSEPFLPPAVFESADLVSRIATREALQLFLAQPGVFSSVWYDEGRTNADAVRVACEELKARLRGEVFPDA